MTTNLLTNRLKCIAIAVIFFCSVNTLNAAQLSQRHVICNYISFIAYSAYLNKRKYPDPKQAFYVYYPMMVKIAKGYGFPNYVIVYYTNGVITDAYITIESPNIFKQRIYYQCLEHF